MADLFNNAGRRNGRAAPTPAAPGRTYATADEAALAYGLGPPDLTYRYHNAKGEFVGVACRWNRDGGKIIKPVGIRGDRWAMGGMATPRPLYQLPDLSRYPDHRVYVTEGEKAADAGRAVGLLTTTSAHGSQSAAGTDWTPLKGRDVCILRDNDAAGLKYANEVADILLKLGCTVRIVLLPDIPEHGDVVEFIESRDGHDAAEIVAEIQALADAAPIAAATAEPTPAAGKPDDLRPSWQNAYSMVVENPQLRDYIIEGHLRESETANFISTSKSYKTFSVMDLGLCVATGRPWLDTFKTRQGVVYIIDNELHKSTIAARVNSVAKAKGIDLAAVGNNLYFESLRGRVKDIHAMDGFFRSIEPGRVKLIILDALYRFYPDGISENDNAQLAGLYNAIDRHAERIGCAFLMVHHCAKGNQANKAVSDVGSGAGTQSRAVDAHIVLRPHAEPGAAVLDAVVRSFKPVSAIALRWNFPLWSVAPDLDPTRLRAPGARQSAAPKEPKPDPEPARTWTPEDFTSEFVTDRAVVKPEIIDLARAAGMSKAAAESLLKRAEAAQLVFRHRTGGAAVAVRYSTEKPSELRVCVARAKSPIARKASKGSLPVKGRTRHTHSTTNEKDATR